MGISSLLNGRSGRSCSPHRRRTAYYLHNTPLSISLFIRFPRLIFVSALADRNGNERAHLKPRAVFFSLSSRSPSRRLECETSAEVRTTSRTYRIDYYYYYYPPRSRRLASKHRLSTEKKKKTNPKTIIISLSRYSIFRYRYLNTSRTRFV